MTLLLIAILAGIFVSLALAFLLLKNAEQAATIKKLSDGQAEVNNRFNKHLISTMNQLDKKANKLSDDDQFLEDAKLSNTISQVAKAAANKRIEDHIAQAKQAKVDAEIDELAKMIDPILHPVKKAGVKAGVKAKKSKSKRK